MAAEKWVFLDIDQLVHEMFDKLIYHRWLLKRSKAWLPPVDIHETQDAHRVVIDLPDVPPADVRFIVTGQSLRTPRAFRARRPAQPV